MAFASGIAGAAVREWGQQDGLRVVSETAEARPIAFFVQTVNTGLFAPDYFSAFSLGKRGYGPFGLFIPDSGMLPVQVAGIPDDAIIDLTATGVIDLSGGQPAPVPVSPAPALAPLAVPSLVIPEADLAQCPAARSELTTQFPINPVPYVLAKVVDGDTPRVLPHYAGEFPTRPGEKSSDGSALRMHGANTVECGAKGEKDDYEVMRNDKCLGGESGAKSARDALQGILAAGGDQVYLQILKATDRYGRPVVIMYVKVTDPTHPLTGHYVDVGWWMVRNGYAHVYTIYPDATGVSEAYLAAMLAAQQEGLGIWSSDNKRITWNLAHGGLHITSVHAKLEAEKDKPDEEYIRVANITGKPVNLKGYQVRNGGTAVVLTDTDFMLPPGGVVKIYTHARVRGSDTPLPNNADTSQELVVNLNQGRRIWSKELPTMILNPEGEVVDGDAKNSNALEQLPFYLTDGADRQRSPVRP